jgi:hypothetical protein
MEGRFDLLEPDGTCYLAGDPLAALLELIGPELESGVVSADFLRERRMRELRLPEEIEVADLTSRKASGFGVTAEIGTIVPYAVPQAWAARLRAAGSAGLLYWLGTILPEARATPCSARTGSGSDGRRVKKSRSPAS